VHHCPKCNSTKLRRSPTRNRWERWRKEITGKRPYRCRTCQWRGWKPIGPLETDSQIGGERHDAPEPPNLRGTPLARQDASRSLDLKELDRFHSETEVKP